MKHFVSILFSICILLQIAACNNNDTTSEPPTEDIIKQKISEQVIGYDKNMIQVSFDEITIGKPRKATSYDDWSRGLEGSLIYPVRVKYVINSKYNNGTTEDNDMKYLFAKDETGEWAFTEQR